MTECALVEVASVREPGAHDRERTARRAAAAQCCRAPAERDDVAARSGVFVEVVLPNEAMKLTRLSAAPGWFRGHTAGGAASCPRRRETAGTASQLIASVRQALAHVGHCVRRDG